MFTGGLTQTVVVASRTFRRPSGTSHALWQGVTSRRLATIGCRMRVGGAAGGVSRRSECTTTERGPAPSDGASHVRELARKRCCFTVLGAEADSSLTASSPELSTFVKSGNSPLDSAVLSAARAMRFGCTAESRGRRTYGVKPGGRWSRRRRSGKQYRVESFLSGVRCELGLSPKARRSGSIQRGIVAQDIRSRGSIIIAYWRWNARI